MGSEAWGAKRGERGGGIEAKDLPMRWGRAGSEPGPYALVAESTPRGGGAPCPPSSPLTHAVAVVLVGAGTEPSPYPLAEW